MTPLQSILAAWLALGLALVGVGALCLRLVGRRIEGGDDWLLSFWLGWAGVVAALELWHLFLPVDDRVRVLVAVVGAVGLVTAGWAAWAGAARGTARHGVAVAGVALLAVWLAGRALAGAQNGDSGFYHIPTVRWFLDYPVIPGLANLFAALAYNQSYFVYVALLDGGPFAHRSHHLANGLLVLALLARVGLALGRVPRRVCRPVDLFYALLFPAVVALAFDINFTSPSPDLAVFALWIVVSAQLLVLLERPVPRAPDLAVLGLLAASAVTVKLSLAGLAAGMVPVAAVVWLRRARPSLGATAAGLGRLAGVMAAVVLPWMIHGVYLSGYPLYPSTLGGLGVEWGAPRAAVVAEANLIRYWNGVQGWWWALLRDPRWFARWLVTLGWLERDVLLPLALAAGAGLVALGVRLWNRRRGTRRVPALVLLPTLAGLAFCFAAAPRARYGSAGFWVLAVQMVVLALEGGARVPSRRLRIPALVVALGLATLPLVDGKPLSRGLTDFEVEPRPELTEIRLATGLVVHVPGPTMCCWDDPAPCTPYPNQALRLRRAGDVAAGFMIDPGVAQLAPAGP